MGQASRPSELVAEMSGGEFGDARLSKRLGKIVATMQVAPEKSFPSLFDDSALEGAYRFFNNEDVTPARILEPHVTATLDRMADESVTLVVHDTSTMSFDPDGARRGLGRIRSAGQAFFAHVSLALSGDGGRMPLGVLGFSHHVREGELKKKKCKAKDNVDGERARWGRQVTTVGSLGHVRERVVHLMDREGDDYALFAQLVGARDRFVIRLAHDRVVEPNGEQQIHKLAQVVAQLHPMAEREVPISRRPTGKRSPRQRKIHPAREGRMAKLAFGATTVVLHRPSSQLKSLPATLTLNVVRVWEIDVPDGESPVEWVLVTTEPIATNEQLLQLVDWYRARWVIEEFFKAIKTGCAYDTRQLETLAGLLNVLATSMPIAWRLLRMRTQARVAPTAAASTVLPAIMIKVLQVFTRIKIPALPTARDVLLAVAALGGHLKSNGEPGWITLGRGYQKLRTLTEGWAAAKGPANWTDV
jgi:Transposase DNA-binding/Transposase DDE domain